MILKCRYCQSKVVVDGIEYNAKHGISQREASNAGN